MTTELLDYKIALSKSYCHGASQDNSVFGQLSSLPPRQTPLENATFIQKNPRVRKICVRNSAAGNGCANFMDTWKNAFFLQEKPMSIKFRVFLGGGGVWEGGGGSANFIFMGARIFLIYLYCHLAVSDKIRAVRVL